MRLPVKLVYVEEQPDRKSAMKREIQIKKMDRERKSRLIVKSEKQKDQEVVHSEKENPEEI
jgi:predicted GIY-YIG superfamily endonuclease